MTKPTVSIYLDKRRQKTNGKYPVKLRLHYNNQDKRYPIGIDVTENDFDLSYKADKPKEKYKQLKLDIAAKEVRANEALKELKSFSFEKFEKKYFREKGAGHDAFYHYEQTINRLKAEGRIGTASSYECSLNSIKAFLEAQGKKSGKLSFEAITPEFLKHYEKWMAGKGRTITTVGIYLRPLKAIFNTAISEGEATKDQYPFGRRLYQIPASRNIKKALTPQEINTIAKVILEPGSHAERARDFFIFSYLCNGMNPKDISRLKYQDIDFKDGIVKFIRAKSENTKKTNLKPITAALQPFATKVIEKYGASSKLPGAYVFDIINAAMTEAEKHRAVQNFTRYLNQHLESLTPMLGIQQKVTTYTARHSYATITVQTGGTMEYVGEKLGHSSVATTMNYFKGFGSDVTKELASKLLDI